MWMALSLPDGNRNSRDFNAMLRWLYGSEQPDFPVLIIYFPTSLGVSEASSSEQANM